MTHGATLFRSRFDARWITEVGVLHPESGGKDDEQRLELWHIRARPDSFYPLADVAVALSDAAPMTREAREDAIERIFTSIEDKFFSRMSTVADAEEFAVNPFISGLGVLLTLKNWVAAKRKTAGDS